MLMTNEIAERWVELTEQLRVQSERHSTELKKANQRIKELCDMVNVLRPKKVRYEDYRVG